MVRSFIEDLVELAGLSAFLTLVAALAKGAAGL